jgi:hypothetical protein
MTVTTTTYPTPHIRVEKTPDRLTAECLVCARDFKAPNKGMGRVYLEVWKSEHQHDDAMPVTTTPGPAMFWAEQQAVAFGTSHIQVTRTEDGTFLYEALDPAKVTVSTRQ